MKKKWLKKGSAILLAAAIVMSLFPGMTGTLATVQAAENEAPTSGYWTDATGLKGFSLDEASDTVGKIIFGQNGSGAAQQWKIAGTDTEIAGDNIILFADKPLETSVFENDYQLNKSFSEDWNCTYSEGTSITDVYPNHYGASDLRSKLQEYASSSAYFSFAEQGKMNNTTIYTDDTKNSVNYTTTDKLYAPYGDYDNDQYVTVGTNASATLNGGVKIDISKWGDDLFWLRSPNDYGSIYAFMACPGNIVYIDDVSGSHVDNPGVSVVPAFNLNLSSDIFASAAEAASSTGYIANSDMTENTYTLRYTYTTGTDSAVINPSGTTVKVTNANNKYLMVQNSTGVYALEINSDDKTINASDIQMGSNAEDKLDNFNNCKVWIESTDAYRITTAKMATQATVTTINSVEVTGIIAPMVDATFYTEAACATTGISSTTPTVTWTPNVTTAGYNTTYTASVTLTTADDYEFASEVAATVNGENATSVTKNDNGTVTVTYEFPATDMAKLISITAPSGITVANGTTYAAMGLPANVAIVTEGNTETTATVAWDTTAPNSGSYSPELLTEQTVTLNGAVICPSNIDQNNVPLTTTITVTISAAGIVGAPTFAPAAGTYTENQSVELSSSTDGATIYYTTDGTTPTTGSNVYSGAISVTGTAGESISTTIKAIAVKAGMQTSSVVSATYVIEIPATTPSDKDEVPKTGDSTPIAWLFVIAIISGAGVVYFSKKKKTAR